MFEDLAKENDFFSLVVLYIVIGADILVIYWSSILQLSHSHVM